MKDMLEHINRLLEKLSTTDYIALEREHYEKVKKEMKRDSNRKYYERNKGRIQQKNAAIIKERYHTDEEFKKRMQERTRKAYQLKKQENQEPENIKENSEVE